MNDRLLKKLILKEIHSVLREQPEDDYSEDEEWDPELHGDVAGYDPEAASKQIDGGKAIKLLDKLGNAVLETEDLFDETETVELKQAAKKFIEKINKKYQLEYNLDWFDEY